MSLYLIQRLQAVFPPAVVFSFLHHTIFALPWPCYGKKLIDVSAKIAAAFEMGRYHEVSVGLDVAVWEKDKVQTLKIVQEILESIKTIRDFIKSSLYQHLQLKTVPDDYTEHLLEKELLSIFGDDSFAFMKDNENWEMLKWQKR